MQKHTYYIHDIEKLKAEDHDCQSSEIAMEHMAINEQVIKLHYEQFTLIYLKTNKSIEVLGTCNGASAAEGT